jgi:LmbE family N-acetylglucosaminyl deacetylase
MIGFLLVALAMWDDGAAGTHLALKRLAANIGVLHITAHPDDEDAALLTTLARGRGFRVSVLSLSRGEGGANLAGPEMYDALGLLRTEEMLSAARHYGVELYFTKAVDFGFSRRMDETLEHWSKDTILRDVVRFVRRWKPDIVVARFHGKPRDGHGNHQTAGLIAIEAFHAAADPKQFPDAGAPWATKKLYLSTRPNEPSTLRVNTAEYDPLLGMTYRELAAIGYRQHRTQGMAAIPSLRGDPGATLQLIENRVGPVDAETDIAAGLPAPAQAMDFDARAPWTVAPKLAAGLPGPRYAEALHKALAVRVDALVEDAIDVAVPGQKFTVTVRVSHAGELEPAGIRLLPPGGWIVRSLEQDRLTASFEVMVPQDALPARPYWSRRNELADHMYTVDDPAHEFLPFPAPELQAEFRYRVAGKEAAIRQPVETQRMDRLWGPQRRTLVVAPPVSIAISPRVAALPAGTAECRLHVEVRGQTAGSGLVRLAGGIHPFTFSGPGEIRTFEVMLKMPPVKAGETRELTAEAEFLGRKWTEGFQVAGYRGLEPRHLFRPARTEIRGIDVKFGPGLHVGYLPGAGDETGKAVAQMGIPVETLSTDDLATGDLSRFTSIVVGVRASAVRADWKSHRERLLRYVQNGGHLIVQYQTQEFDEAPYGPYPYKLTARADEVSEEAAPVRILRPDHPAFAGPNRIALSDFDGWVEERGSKWMVEWDSRYAALLESRDREQPPLRGGLLIANYGKGFWTYAAYAFYRQLPAGVPGAWRLFANLLSLR